MKNFTDKKYFSLTYFKKFSIYEYQSGTSLYKIFQNIIRLLRSLKIITVSGSVIPIREDWIMKIMILFYI